MVTKTSGSTMKQPPSTGRSLARGGAAFVLLCIIASMTAPSSLFTAAKANESKIDPDGTCQWEDEEGLAKCKEMAHRRREDAYLPNSDGSRDYVDGDGHLGLGDGESENENDDDYYNDNNDDDGYGYYGYSYDEEEEEEEKEEEQEKKEEEGQEKKEEEKQEEKEEDSDNESDEMIEEDEEEQRHREYLEWRNSYRPEVAEGEEWDVWKHGGKMDIYNELNCPEYDYSKEDMFTGTSIENIHTTETWKTFNQVYNKVIAAVKENEVLKQDPTIPPQYGEHGFQFPIVIKFDPEVGRGVYAKADIPKGSLLYISTNNAAFFNGQTFRYFLKALPSRLACDVMIWAFVRWVSMASAETDEHMICVDLDEGSFVNSADDEDSYNMALGTDEGVFYGEGTWEEKESLWFGCKMKFFAYRDIKAGEEIRAAYNDFAEVEGWAYLGL